MLHLAEWVLERPVKRVLDVGCGEGQWGVALRKRRRGLHYVGVDPSAWAVARHGAKRGLLEGGITDLDALLPPARQFDLVLCVGMLNYLDAGHAAHRIAAGGATHRRGGVPRAVRAGDEYVGDTDWPTPKPGRLVPHHDSGAPASSRSACSATYRRAEADRFPRWNAARSKPRCGRLIA